MTIKPGQFYVAKDDDGEVLRRLRIIGDYPFTDTPRGTNIKSDDYVLIEDFPSKMIKHSVGEIRLCPRHNLMMVFELEEEENDE